MVESGPGCHSSKRLKRSAAGMQRVMEASSRITANTRYPREGRRNHHISLLLLTLLLVFWF